MRCALRERSLDPPHPTHTSQHCKANASYMCWHLVNRPHYCVRYKLPGGEPNAPAQRTLRGAPGPIQTGPAPTQHPTICMHHNNE